MAHSTVRIAAGAGVVAASLLIVGPNPADAAADSHGSGHSNNDFRKNGSGAQGGYAQRAASNFVRDVVDGIGSIAGIGPNSKPSLDPPKMDLGTSGGGTEDLFVVQSLAPEGQSAMRSAAIAEAPVGDNVSAAVAAPGGGSGYSGQRTAAFRAPNVTFGNGRTPGANIAKAPSEAVLARGARTATQAVPTAPAMPSAIEINIPPLPPPLPPVERIRSADLVVGEYGYGTTVTVTDPLAGAAGLILIPAIGAVLGYRQARAAQSLRDSLRT